MGVSLLLPPPASTQTHKGEGGRRKDERKGGRKEGREGKKGKGRGGGRERRQQEGKGLWLITG